MPVYVYRRCMSTGMYKTLYKAERLWTGWQQWRASATLKRPKFRDRGNAFCFKSYKSIIPRMAYMPAVINIVSDSLIIWYNGVNGYKT